MEVTTYLCLGLLSILCFPYVLCGNSGFYMDSKDQTVLLDKLSRKQQRYLKTEMLQILGLEKVPRVKKNKVKSAPKYMIDLYHKYANHLENEAGFKFTGSTASSTEDADLVISFVNHAHKQPHLRHDPRRMYYFDFSDVPATESVRRADFRLYKLPARLGGGGAECYSVAAYQLVKDSFEAEQRLELRANTSVRADYRGWIDLNVTEAATAWTYFPVSNLGLQLEITDAHGRSVEPRELGLVGRHGPDDAQPFLVSYFKSDQRVHKRSRRGAGGGRKSAKRNSQPGYRDSYYPYREMERQPCQRRTLFVSFEDLKWQEWIIAPKGYSAFYCYGQCPFPLSANLNATNHAIVQTLVSTMNDNAPKPCCAPTKLSPLSVLYFDERSNVILKDYQNMVVKACGCH